MADLALHPLFLKHPDWRSGFDLDPQQAAQSRHRLLDQVARTGTPVLGYHLPPFPGIARVMERDTGWLWRSAELTA